MTEDTTTLAASTDVKPFKLTFNQDITCLSAGTEAGYRLYNLGRLPEALDLLYHESNASHSKNISGIQRLFTSSLIAFVSNDAPNKLYLTHFRKNSIICDYQYASPIVSIQLNRNRLVVILDDHSIHIHAIKDMSLIHTLRDCKISPTACPGSAIALASPLSASALSNLIAYPTNLEKGEVAVFDAYLLRTIRIIDAHENCISAMSFANNSSFRAGSQDNPLFLATSSQRGTVIRVWAIPTGVCLKELRRGMYTADIKQLSFSMDAKYLTLISNTLTVHIFELKMDSGEGESSGENTPARSVVITDEEIDSPSNDIDNSWYTYLTGLATSMLSITSSYVDATYQMATGGVIERSKTACRLPVGHEAQAVAILKNLVLIATLNNKLLVYEMNCADENHEDCTFLKEFDLNHDQQAPILNHNQLETKHQTDATSETSQANTTSLYSQITKGPRTAYLTRSTSKQIDIDLSHSS